jgi:Family of unknown function (DUF6582)
MPYTARQRRLFHYREEHPGGGMSHEEAHRLADEADKLTREGKEKPAKKALAYLGSLLAKREMPQGEHKTPPAGYPKDRSEYADPEHYMFPIDTHEHTRAAIGYFDKHHWSSSEHKASAARRILRAARKHGIEVSKDSGVARAAHGG